MPDPRSTLAASLSDRYRIEREPSGGGMSRVFLAREHGLDREVVIKVLPEDIAAGVSAVRFEREIRRFNLDVARLTSPDGGRSR